MAYTVSPLLLSIKKQLIVKLKPRPDRLFPVRAITPFGVASFPVHSPPRVEKSSHLEETRINTFLLHVSSTILRVDLPIIGRTLPFTPPTEWLSKAPNVIVIPNTLSPQKQKLFKRVVHPLLLRHVPPEPKIPSLPPNRFRVRNVPPRRSLRLAIQPPPN